MNERDDEIAKLIYGTQATYQEMQFADLIRADERGESDMKEALKQMLNDVDVGLKNALIRVNELVAENKALKEALAQPEQKPVEHAVIAGALFDFMGWLTSRKERLVLSSVDDASPAVEAITEFAKMRDLSLDDAKVMDWNT